MSWFQKLKEMIIALFTTKIPATQDRKTEWMDWMRERIGWGESLNGSILAKYWRLTNHRSDSINGRQNAWCAMIVNAALHETGYKGNGRADALSFTKYGTNANGLVQGCIVVIKHKNGGHHVAFLDRVISKTEIALLGGNQDDKIKVKVYSLLEEKVLATRMPVKA